MDPVDGTTITDAQINAVLDYYEPLVTDPDPNVAVEATGWVAVCNGALAGSGRRRGMVAAQYNQLVSEGTIQPA